MCIVNYCQSSVVLKFETHLTCQSLNTLKTVSLVCVYIDMYSVAKTAQIPDYLFLRIKQKVCSMLHYTPQRITPFDAYRVNFSEMIS